MRQLLGIVGTRATMMLCWRATPEKEGSFKYLGWFLKIFGLVLENIWVGSWKYLGWFLKIFGLVLAITNIIPPSDPAVTETLGNWDPRRSRTNQFLLHTFLNSSQSDIFWRFWIFTGVLSVFHSCIGILNVQRYSLGLLHCPLLRAAGVPGSAVQTSSTSSLHYGMMNCPTASS